MICRSVILELWPGFSLYKVSLLEGFRRERVDEE